MIETSHIDYKVCDEPEDRILYLVGEGYVVSGLDDHRMHFKQFFYSPHYGLFYVKLFTTPTEVTWLQGTVSFEEQ